MIIPTPAGDVEVLIGDQFECEGAKVEVVCFRPRDHKFVTCRVVSGLLVAQVRGPHEGEVIDEEFKPGDLLTCKADHVAIKLLTRPIENSPRIPKTSASTKARANKKEKSQGLKGNPLFYDHTSPPLLKNRRPETLPTGPGS